MSERIAYVWDTIIECQECGEKRVGNSGTPTRPYALYPKSLFDEPGRWSCDTCGKPLFPDEWTQRQKDGAA